jgi:large subunit ribosomal protein L20
MKLAKGYFGRKKNVWTVAKNQVEKSWGYAYRDRRAKKREFRRLWIQRINAAARMHGATYSQFIGKATAAGIALNRKVLADLAMNNPAAFKAVYDYAMSATPVAATAKAPAAPAAKPVKKEAPAPVEKAPVEEAPVASNEEE